MPCCANVIVFTATDRQEKAIDSPLAAPEIIVTRMMACGCNECRDLHDETGMREERNVCLCLSCLLPVVFM